MVVVEMVTISVNIALYLLNEPVIHLLELF
jgi:hypothetical protein